jgi:uncharacterized protein YbjT (DUF2867 family)
MLRGASVAILDPDDVGIAAAALLNLADPSPHYGKKYMITGPQDVNDDVIRQTLSEVFGKRLRTTDPSPKKSSQPNSHTQGFQNG